MRRSDKTIKDPTVIQHILKTTEICRIAFALDNVPYVIPMNFAYKNQSIYIHAAPEGKKMEYLQKNNKVCFEITGMAKIISGKRACDWTTQYQSVIGYGNASVLTKKEEKINGLNYLMEKYAGMKSPEYDEALLKRMIILKIDIVELSGKESGF